MQSFTESNLPESRIGRRILRYDRVDSTNTVAAGFAVDPANDGLVVVADEQTAGRGRHGRTWRSAPGSNILLSVLLFPPESLRRSVVLTTLAAVAVCETIYETMQIQAAIKWPNDVLIHGKKVCGILVEQGRGTVIGIGLNVHEPPEAFAAAELTQAASLRMFAGSELNREEITHALIHRLDADYADLLRGNLADLESRWRWHGGVLGKHVAVQCQNNVRRGRLREMSFQEIVIENDQGQILRFPPETITQLTPSS